MKLTKFLAIAASVATGGTLGTVLAAANALTGHEEKTDKAESPIDPTVRTALDLASQAAAWGHQDPLSVAVAAVDLVHPPEGASEKPDAERARVLADRAKLLAGLERIRALQARMREGGR